MSPITIAPVELNRLLRERGLPHHSSFWTDERYVIVMATEVLHHEGIHRPPEGVAVRSTELPPRLIQLFLIAKSPLAGEDWIRVERLERQGVYRFSAVQLKEIWMKYGHTVDLTGTPWATKEPPA